MWQYYLQWNIQVAWHSLFVPSNLQLERSVGSHLLKPKHSATALQQPKQHHIPRAPHRHFLIAFPQQLVGQTLSNALASAGVLIDLAIAGHFGRSDPPQRTNDVTMYSRTYIHTAYRYVYTYIYIQRYTIPYMSKATTCNLQQRTWFIHLHTWFSEAEGCIASEYEGKTEWNNTHHFHLHGHTWPSRREHAPM